MATPFATLLSGIVPNGWLNNQDPATGQDMLNISTALALRPKSFRFQSKPTATANFIDTFVESTTIPANFAGTKVVALTAATATTTFTVKTSIQGAGATTLGTIAISSAGVVTLSTQAAVTLNPGDSIIITTPAQDATLADVCITIPATLA